MTDLFNNSFIVGYLKYFANNSEVYYQEFNYDISPQSEPVKINDDWGSSNQYKPQVKFNSIGESIIVWYDQRNGRDELYAQLYDADFNPINSNICLSDTPIYWSTGYYKDIVSLSDGTFIVVWLGSDDGYPTYLVGQKISRNGEKLGNNKILQEPIPDYTRINLGINTNDEIAMCFYDSYRVKYKMFDGDLATIRNEITLLSINYPISYRAIDTYIDDDLSLLVTLQYYNNSINEYDKNLHCVHFDSRGNIKSAFVIDSLAGYVTDIDCRKDGWDVAVMYTNNGITDLKRIYPSKDGKTTSTSFGYAGYNALPSNILEFKDANIFLIYNTNNTLWGFYANDSKRKTSEFIVQKNINLLTSPTQYEYDYGISLSDDKIVLAYQSSINGNTGVDIWANVKRIDDLDFSKSFFYPEQRQDFLYDNFPNPFNPATTIAYELLAFHKVKLTVYDILGREVKTLVNEYQEKGVYEVGFDASDLASGVYFYKLEAFDTTIKKMLLIK
ncbi:MAG: T9SS type A sorting domain-containing protein [Ignavibacteriales bacterium]|nr:MAG: T9SS type A sorting domain-containing protein [Ignavibacteriales bacterium]